jgi:hypothetical protein
METGQPAGSNPGVRLQAVVDAAVPFLAAIEEAASGRRPHAGGWSAREILGHLIDSASRNHERFVR